MDDTRQALTKMVNQWAKYSQEHRLIRISEFPRGVSAPEKVRLYARRDHYVLQWWEKQEKRTLNERVEGDLVTAIARAREIDNRLQHFKSSGRKWERCSHATIVDRFMKGLQLRADAGEIDVATTRRYESALRRHYLPFMEQPDISRKYRQVSAVDGAFQKMFAAFLSRVQVSPNGHPNARTRPLKQTTFIMDAVRAMFEWAADTDRGNLLPEGFRNPFARRKRETRQVAADLLNEPDISVSMAVNLLDACDPIQLAIFAPLALYGLRPGELGWLFREYVKGGWVQVPCNLDLDYLTKGRRQKTFPVVGCLGPLWRLSGPVRHGLLYVRRQVDDQNSQPPLLGSSLPKLVEEYRRRSAAQSSGNAKTRRRIRDTLLQEAGQLKYDYVECEFRKLARSLEWPTTATLKDLRHLFATCLENAGIPEFYRRYFMGQSFGRAAIVSYTHITADQVKRHYEMALTSELAPLVTAIERRSMELGIL